LDNIYVATKNLHKVLEFEQLLRRTTAAVLPLPISSPDSPETGETFLQNAFQKAQFYGEYCDGWVLADDSGLSVPALGGAPGVYSARYAGIQGDDWANNQKLLQNLKLSGGGEVGGIRSAQFHCALVLYHTARAEGYFATGSLDGIILQESRGTNGFGYDPLFYVSEENKTLAEMTTTKKNAISHRARAVKRLLEVCPGILA